VGRASSSKYFIMKSINHENISKSVAEGIWATQTHNEAKLNEAFRSVGNVYLIFSVNGSGCFQVCPPLSVSLYPLFSSAPQSILPIA
jgi:hypothetical protein